VLRAVRAYEPRQLVVTGGAGAAETDDVFRVAGLMQDTDRMEFPRLSLSEAIGIFTEAV
jgi:hypothetical protein